MQTEIRQTIEQNFTIVTPTKRLSQTLQKKYTSHQLSMQKKIWETPDILPWGSWIIRLWENWATQQNLPLILLNTHQQHYLWKKVISHSKYTQGLLHDISQTAYNALKTARAWQLKIFPQNVWLDEDALAFQSWVNKYQQHCHDNYWLDMTSLEAELLNIPKQYANKYAQNIFVVGFDELTPAQKSLLETLKEAGSNIKELQQPNDDHCSDVVWTSFAESRQEITAAAYWARKYLEENEHNTIGIVVPELEKLRDDIENIFDDILVPANLFSINHQILHQRPYNISLGKALADYPVIHIAITILGLTSRYIRMENISILLRSPFTAAAESEMISRAQLDAYLRQQNEPIFTVVNLLKQLKQNWSDRCPQFIVALEAWHKISVSQSSKQNCSTWAEHFRNLLNAFSWPGERSLHSDELQTIETWQDLLNQFISLDLVIDELSYQDALSELCSMTRQQIYQPYTTDVPIQVMGLLEAGGMQFDHLWVMGLHADSWPATSHPDPFIPTKLQQQYNMLHASPEHELVYARLITSRLAASADTVIFSSPLNNNQQELKPSPLITQFNHTEITQQEVINYAGDIFNARQTESLLDDKAPEVIDKSVAGGAGLFKDQSACPFRAFARYRLGAQSLMEPEPGLNAMERGQLVHKCLQLFWNKINSHKALLELDEAHLQSIIHQCVDAVLKHFQARQRLTDHNKFMQIEKQRLRTLLHEWLAKETQRQSFKVLATEQQHHFSMAGLNFQGRIDRIDQLDDGSWVIIDYKTSKNNLGSWMGERPDEPQLPLYAITLDGQVSAIVFAQLIAGEFKFVGLTDNTHGDEVAIPGLKKLSEYQYAQDLQDWSVLLGSWSQHLLALAENFRQGDARVNPHKPLETCRYCDLGSLCRINELSE